MDCRLFVTAWRVNNPWTFANFTGENAKLQGFFKVAEGIVGNQLESSFQRDFDNLKAILEG